jgi:uncharacterized damage-inducible protein DinB
MQMTVQQLAASRTQRAAHDLIAAAESTPADRLAWVPMGEARTMMDQLTECVIANIKWTTILKTHRYANVPREVWEAVVPECDTLAKVTARLRQSAADLIQAIGSVRDEETADEIETDWGPYSLADCCLHAYWNMVYHEGQINYIQTLYGDTEEHY